MLAAFSSDRPVSIYSASGLKKSSISESDWTWGGRQVTSPGTGGSHSTVTSASGRTRASAPARPNRRKPPPACPVTTMPISSMCASSMRRGAPGFLLSFLQMTEPAALRSAPYPALSSREATSAAARPSSPGGPDAQHIFSKITGHSMINSPYDIVLLCNEYYIKIPPF